MTSAQLRNSFLEFFREKEHSIVTSSSLLPDSPNLLFTNAGMNQFVPIFLGKAACPYSPARAADTQKCIRAGGKHNDLEDVGLDTYHHTFFEMLGNWSFGDYFKTEAITWAWELLVERWKFPAHRLYATVYRPAEGDPAEFDQEAYDIWTEVFQAAGLDPARHIVYGNRKDNFWMMGETGPCGPCSEIHVDLTPAGNTGGNLVNKGDARCIEIWNLVFIQYNANPDATFTPLPARHVDTGMGFERVASVMQCTDDFRHFNPAKISNYGTDVFRPYFAELERRSGKRYGSTLPAAGTSGATEGERIDIALRVIADHIRTLTFAIADGIVPSNDGRGYVLRRILRRAVRYGRLLGFYRPFLHELVATVGQTMGSVFSSVERQVEQVGRIVRGEEESFIKTLDRGLDLFEEVVTRVAAEQGKTLPGPDVFKLYDTYGFPLDLTELMARERGLGVDAAGFEVLMEEQRARSQAAQKREIISIDTVGTDLPATLFLGYETLEATARVIRVEESYLVVDQSPFYAEMGGQVGDSGELLIGDAAVRIENTTKAGGGAFIHKLGELAVLQPGVEIGLRVDPVRREKISIHHSATHLLHWALREVLGETVAQKGSQVGPDRFRFDFSHPHPVSGEQLALIQELMVGKIAANDPIVTRERPYEEVKGDPSILQFFSDKYGDTVRVVELGDYSKELCGGTHVGETGRLGFVKIILESGIAAGVRRIEAVAGEALTDHVYNELPKQDERWNLLAAKKANLQPLPAFVPQLDPHDNWRQLLRRQELLAILDAETRQWEKQEAVRVAAGFQQEAESQSFALIAGAKVLNGIHTLIEDLGCRPPEYLNHLVDVLKKRWTGILVLASNFEGKAFLAVNVAEEYRPHYNASNLLQELLPLVKGKGGGKPSFARGAGEAPERISAALKRAEQLF